MAEEKQIWIGDWVRFMRGGELVISVVCYIRPTRPFGYPEVVTEKHGSVLISDVLEVRQKEESK